VDTDEIERLLKANKGKTVTVVDVDGEIQNLFVHSVDEEGFVCDIAEMTQPPAQAYWVRFTDVREVRSAGDDRGKMTDANGRLPKIIPPRSRVRLAKAEQQTPTWRKDVGRRFRVGYYSRKDGLDCIWLVNEDGEYEQTTDRKSLLKYFEIERLSHEKNF